MALDTLANVKTRLNILVNTDDALLTKLMEGAGEWIRRYCDRDLEGGTFTEEFAGGSEFVCLRNYPVDTVLSVRVDPQRNFGEETILPPEAFVVHASRGVIQSVSGPFLPAARRGLVGAELRSWTHGPKVVRVTYSTIALVPDDVKTAFARLVGAWYRQAKTESASGFVGVSQQKIGDTFVIYDRPPASGIPSEILGLLAPHRVPAF